MNAGSKPPPQGCPHLTRCPGCPGFGRHLRGSARIAPLERLARHAGIPLGVLESEAREGFRVRARLACRGRARSPKLGIFERGSHRAVDIPGCRIHHPALNCAARTLKALARSRGIAPYSDAAHAGLLRYVQLVVERASERLQIVLACNSESPAPILGLATDLEQTLGHRLHSLWWNGHTRRNNAILGPEWRLLAGEQHFVERISDRPIYFPPGAFGQSHLAQYERVVETVRGLVPAGDRIVEFYAGVGALGLALLADAQSVTFNEISPASLQGLQLGLAAHEGAARGRIVSGAAGDCAHLVEHADTVIVDPPRKGLDRPLLNALRERPLERVVYLACGLNSFVRDVEALLGPGGYRLDSLHAVDFFPFTEHVETLAFLSPA